MHVTRKLVSLYKDGEETQILDVPTTTRKWVTNKLEEMETQQVQAHKSHGMGACSWVNSMLRSSSVMLVAHSPNMGSFRTLGLVQEDHEWVRVRIVTKNGEGSIILPWYSKFDLFLGSP